MLLYEFKKDCSCLITQVEEDKIFLEIGKLKAIVISRIATRNECRILPEIQCSHSMVHSNC